MHGSRIAILIGTAVAGPALLLPQVRLPNLGPIDGIEGDAWPALVLLAPAVLVAVVGDAARPLRPLASVVAVASGCAGLLLSVVKLLDAGRAARKVAGSVEIGAWVVPSGALIVIGGAVLGLAGALRRREFRRTPW